MFNCHRSLRTVLLAALSLGAAATALAAEPRGFQQDFRPVGSANKDQVRPLAVLDGRELFMQWPAVAVTAPAIVAYDLARQQVLWTHATDSSDIEKFYLTPTTIIFSQPKGVVTWLDRASGQLLASVEVRQIPRTGFSAIFAGDRVLISHSVLYDAATGDKLAEISQLDPYTRFIGAEHILDGPMSGDERGPFWTLREFDRTTGKQMRTIEILPKPDDKVTESRGSLHVSSANSGRAQVHVYGNGFSKRCFVDLSSGTVTWLDAIQAEFIEEVDGRLLFSSVENDTRFGIARKRTLYAQDAGTTAVLWETDIPPLAPVMLVNHDGAILRPLGSSANIYGHYVYLDVTTGEISTRQTGPSPMDRLAWQIGAFQPPLEIRAFGDLSVAPIFALGTGHQTGKTGGIGVWHGWRTATGELVWTWKLNYSEPAKWLPDVNETPQFIVIAYPHELTVLEAATGNTAVTLNPDAVGLRNNFKGSSEGSTPSSESGGTKEAPADSSMKQYRDNLLTPILFIMLLAAVWLWSKTRKPSPRELVP